ncbi:MAG TPA: YhfT family protein [Bacillota bacterium]|nr:YhfT family protein [Bacillota bacterium]
MKVLLVGLAGALASLMANRSIAVFNDAVRPLTPEFVEGRMKRREFFLTTFGLSFGLVIGFGIPFSLTSPIILVHSLFLGTDILGAAFPGDPQKKLLEDRKSLLGAAGATLAGGIYGILLVVGLGKVVDLFESLPVETGDSMSSLGDPVLFTFAAFPAIAVAYQYTIKKGIIAISVTIISRILAELQTVVDPDGIALFVGIFMLFIFALTEKRDSNGPDNVAALFTERTKRIRSNIFWIAGMGALYGITTHMAFLMEGPQSLLALSEGKIDSAISMTIARALSFVPLKGMTSLSTGTFVTDGFGFTATVGLLSSGVIMAAILGAIVMSLEALSLSWVAKVFDKFPGIRNAADNLRNAMTQVLEIALIVGAMIAANNLMPGIGFLIVISFYLLNETAGRPVVRMAVGPISVIAIAIIANVLAWTGLYIPS